MSRFLVSALGAAVLLTMIATLALAGQPDPGQCYGDDYVGVSPKNLTAPPAQQYVYSFTLLDNLGTPVAGFPASQVELRFTACNNPSTRPSNEIIADGDSDANGLITWSTNLNWGGGDPCYVDVLVQNAVFKTMGDYPTDNCGGLRSVDEDGDGNVALSDLVVWQPAFVTGGPAYQGDLAQPFDCASALADLVTWQQHFTAP